MTGFFPLLRLQLLSRFADMKPKNLKTAFKEKRGRTVGMFIAVLILIVYMAGFLYFIEKKALDLMMPMGMGDVIVSLSVILATGATLIMAFFFVMSSLYGPGRSVYRCTAGEKPDSTERKARPGMGFRNRD